MYKDVLSTVGFVITTLLGSFGLSYIAYWISMKTLPEETDEWLPVFVASWVITIIIATIFYIDKITG